MKRLDTSLTRHPDKKTMEHGKDPLNARIVATDRTENGRKCDDETEDNFATSEFDTTSSVLICDLDPTQDNPILGVISDAPEFRDIDETSDVFSSNA